MCSYSGLSLHGICVNVSLWWTWSGYGSSNGVCNGVPNCLVNNGTQSEVVQKSQVLLASSIATSSLMLNDVVVTVLFHWLLKSCILE